MWTSSGLICCSDMLAKPDVSSLQGLTGPIGDPGADGPPGQKVSD